MTQAALNTKSSRISSVAHRNPHINTIFVYLFIQELFVNKIHFFKFFSMSDKPRLHQLNVATSSRSSTVVQASLTAWMFSFVWGNTIYWEQMQNITNLLSTLKFLIPYSLVFRKFSYRTYRNGLNQVPQSWGTLKISKSTNRVSSIPFVGNPHFSILLHRVRYLKNLFMSQR